MAAVSPSIDFRPDVSAGIDPPAGSENGSSESVAGPAVGEGIRGLVAPRHDPRAVIASAWRTDAEPGQVAFRAWVDRYVASAPEAREGLVAAGLAVVEARRAELAARIVRDPEGALAAAVPLAVRARLPASVVARLEQRVSGPGELGLLAATPAPGGPPPSSPVFRSALVDGVEYRAHVYGRRATQATVPAAAIVGIALDGAIAIADSPVRILEQGETPAAPAPVLTCADCAAALAGGGAPGAVPYQYAGRFGVAATPVHFAADAARLEAAERDQSEPPTAADNQPGSSSVVGRPALSWSHGAKTVLVVRVDFSDLAGTPVSDDAPLTEAAAVELIRGAGGVAEFFAASSFGKTSIVIRPAVNGDSPDVTGVLRLPKTAAFYASNGANSTLHADARAAARTAGFDPDSYDRVCVAFSSLGDLPGTKITYGGLASIIGSSIWVNGSYNFRVVAHEFGHTYGLFHANRWEFSDGNPVSETGTSLEYGDPFDLMGGSSDGSGDFGPWGKSVLQWIPDTAVTVAETGGTYRVHRVDGVGANLNLPRALKVVREPGRDYWIGYRRAKESTVLDNSAYVVWGYDTNRQGNVLDLATPAIPDDEPVLPVGATFDDTFAGLTLRPVAQGGSGANEWIEIQVNFRPRVQWVAPVVLAEEQSGKATLVLRRTGNASGAVSIAYATESGGAVAGVDFTAVSGMVSWADGDSADKKIEIPLAADTVVEGSETFSVRLGAVTGGARIGPAAAVVTIGEPGARDVGFRADFINSAVARVLPLPDGGFIAGGFFTQLQDGSFKLYDFKRVARFGANGAIDPEFNPGEGANGAVQALARQADGRILVGGEFTSFAGVPAGRIVRLNPDGSVDTSFRIGTGADNAVQTIVALPDGRLLVGGFFSTFNGVARNRVVRLEADGSIDASYANPTFTASAIRDIAIQPDGKVILAGGLSYSGVAGVGFKSGVARFNTDGTRDATFDVGFGAHTVDKTNVTTTVYRVALQPDGRVVVAGSFTGFGGLTGTARRGVARLSSTGVVDTAFVPGVQGNAFALLALPDGSVLVGGDFTQVGVDAVARLARIRADGTLDPAFSAPGGFGSTVLELARTGDGRVLVAGNGVALQGATNSRPVWRLLSGLPQPAGVVEFTSDLYSAGEGSMLNLMVRRTGGALGALRVGYAAARGKADDTAGAASDYTLAAGVLEWADGDAASKMIPVALIADGVAETAEAFTVRLGEALVGGAALGARQEAMVTIAPPAGGPQTITFEPLPDRILGPTPAPITLAASASSGLPVTFTLVSGPATLSGATLTPTGVGTVVVRATQAGGGSVFAATPVERSFEVFTVTLTGLAQNYAGTPRTVGFTSSRPAFNANISYAGSPVAPSAVGTYAVALTSADPQVAGGVTGTLVIAKAPLVARPVDQVRMLGADNLPLVVGYQGFVGGDTAAVLDTAPVASTKAVKVSKAGDYPITLAGGADNNYAITLEAGTLKVVSFGGSYEALVTPPGGGEPFGKVELTVSATAPTFTGVLNLADETAPVAITATPVAFGANVADGASGLWTSKAAAPKNYRVSVNLTATGCLVDVYRGATLIAEGAGPVVFVPAAKAAVAWAGDYSAWLDGFAARVETDLRAAPRGATGAAVKIPATGVATLALTLPDGVSKVAGAFKPDSAGGYRVFARPTANRASSYTAGFMSADGAPRVILWRKTGVAADASYRAGFDLRGRSTLRRWVAPSGASPLVSILGLNGVTGAFAANHGGDGLGESAGALPGGLLLARATNKVTLATATNPTAWALALTPATGAFTGGFTLTDFTPAATPGKPAVKVVRKVSFTGVLRAPRGTDADPNVLGRGFFVVPPLVKGAEAFSGEIQLTLPPAP